ncbi:MAG: lipoprotein-releasing ABC transporter permease subunit [Gammaproteobacteria bacterium]|nr:MAG: lipoprotein-releasing ABC transporter permease subunit [Gammaproteobacteria bacterium]
MFHPLALCIGLRYTRAKRRNHFISFITLTSVLGVTLGVTALITVLSVMNGFEKELKERILGMTAHATLHERGVPMKDWRTVLSRVEREPEVLAAAPFVRSEGMLTHAGRVHGVLVRGVEPSLEPRVSRVGSRMIEGSLDSLEPGGFRIVLGHELARFLRARVGDKVTLVAPEPATTAIGILPRLRRFTVSGIFEVGMNEYDANMALINLQDASKMFRLGGGASGLRLKFADLYDAPRIARDLARRLGDGFLVIDWTQYHKNFFRALKTEKTVMFVILALIVAVAAFNIVSTLVMVVTDKQADIAILRTLGLSPRRVMRVFMVQGLLIGLGGTLLGIAGGVWLAEHVTTIVPAIERMFNTQFLPADVYYISELPSDLRLGDVVTVGLVAFLMCLLGTLYPSWRASRVQPAEALRYE